jgi:hypothetical protein
VAPWSEITESESLVDIIPFPEDNPHVAMDPWQVKQMWQAEHGPLTQDLADRFMRRPEVKELATLPPAVVRKAVADSPKLVDIVPRARELVRPPEPAPPTKPRRRSARNSLTPLPTQRSAPATARAAPPRRDRALGPAKDDSKTNSTKTKRADRPGPEPHHGGPPGSWATYGSGMVRNPGSSEVALGERCSNCDAFIPTGAAHDCW